MAETNAAKQQAAEKPAPVKQGQNEPAIPLAISKDIDELMRRLRQLEERYSGLRKKSQLIEQNMLKDAKDVFEEIRLLHQTTSELKSEMSEISEKLMKLADEVKGAVPKTEFNVLARYLDFWQPMNFLTREDAEKILNELRK